MSVSDLFTALTTLRLICKYGLWCMQCSCILEYIMSLTESDKKTAVLSASDLLRLGSLSCEFECKGILETRTCYFIFYLIMTPTIFLSLFSIEVLMKEKLGL